MKKEYKKNRVRTLKDITARHQSREIEGCHSWRHFAVHQDRAWLLNALGKIRSQAQKIQQAINKDQSTLNAEVQTLLRLFDEETLDHLGDESK